jgi:hypothetical protein
MSVCFISVLNFKVVAFVIQEHKHEWQLQVEVDVASEVTVLSVLIYLI